MELQNNGKGIHPVLLLFLLLPFFFGVDIFVGLLSLYIVIMFFRHKVTLNKDIILVLLPLMFLLVIGSFSFFSNSVTRDGLRDVLYFLIPILMALVGYLHLLKKRDLSKLLNTIVIAGVIAAMQHLINVALNAQLLTVSVEALRDKAGYGSLLSVASILILLFNKKFQLNVFRYKRFKTGLSLLIPLTSILISFSRTLIFILIIMIICMVFRKINPFGIKLTNLIIVITMFSLPIIAAVAFYLYTSSNLVDQLIFKFQNSITEMSSKQTTNWTWEEVNRNWRGYEAYRAQLLFSETGLFHQLFGSGFGSRVQLGLRMVLGGEPYTSIPILHNGYMYILTKTGIIGIVIYVMTMLYIMLVGFRTLKTNKFLGKIVISVGITELIITNFSMGILGFTYTVLPLFIGIACAMNVLSKKEVIGEENKSVSAKPTLEPITM